MGAADFMQKKRRAVSVNIFKHASTHTSIGILAKQYTVTVFFVIVTICAGFFCSPQNAYADSLNPTVAVVNFQPSWGDVDANVQQMKAYLAQADEQDADIVLFPEMCITGYVSTDDLSSPEAKMAVDNAESADGPVATEVSQLAQKYDMWVVYGNTELISGDESHAYNSAFACSPDGVVSTYQKIHPVEGAWCVPGANPMILSTEWGKIGVNICYDTYAVPELERYYAAQGCKMILNPTATSRGFDAKTGDSTVWQKYFTDRIDNIAIRDGIYVASSNLTGYDGSHYTFPGGSSVIGPSGSSGTENFQKCYAGSPSEDNAGIYVGTVDFSLATATDILQSENFKPNLYTQWYKDLANDGAADEYTSPSAGSAKVATVNFQPTFGNKEANFESMKNYIEEAAANGVNILVFPEMALTGYAATSNEGDANGQAVVDIAEPADGKYATAIAELAKQYDMYIVFGTAEPISGDTAHAYNSVFVASLNASVQSYRKIAPVEGPWCTAGEDPLIVDTPYGAMGISICKDTYGYPELARYYMAKGCTYLINPTARTGTDAGWENLYTNALENLADQDKMIVISADLCGADLDAPAEQVSWGSYSGGSGICAPLNSAENGSYVTTWGSFKSDPSNTGMVTAEISFDKLWLGNGDAVTGFNPSLYAEMYSGATFTNPSVTIPTESENPGEGSNPNDDNKDTNNTDSNKDNNSNTTTEASDNSGEDKDGSKTETQPASDDSENKTSTLPITGDNNLLIPIAAITVIAAGGATTAGVMYYRKKRNEGYRNNRVA